MVQKAKVVDISGNLAVVEVSRRAMCDGCHKTGCGGKCAMSAIFATGSTMTASAANDIGAEIGDTVEIETSDREVLGTAAVVFILPIIIGGLFYASGMMLKLSSQICAVLAVAGFAAVLPFLRLIEKKKRKMGPQLFINRIITDDADYSDEELDN